MKLQEKATTRSDATDLMHGNCDVSNADFAPIAS